MSSPSPSAESAITHVVELTPIGRAAVAVVLVDGPVAVRAVDKCFATTGGRPLACVPENRIVVGCWQGPGGEELVVCRRGEERVEVHCHGGVAAVRAVVDALAAEGCRETGWHDWLRFESSLSRVSPKLESASRRDATTCAAQIALADALTARTAAILLDQLNGALAAACRKAMAAISASDWSRATELVSQLFQRRTLGLHLTTPWRVVLAGPPNVGKSSLINALAGYERAIVSPVPGTTRDVVTLTTAIDGWPVELADTAGLRATGDELESAGAQLAEASLASADLVIMVRDATNQDAGVESRVEGRGSSAVVPSRILHVRNKIDLVGASKRRSAASGTEIGVSAVTGEGIAELAAAIGRSLVPDPPAAGAAISFTQAHVEALEVAQNAIERRHAAAACEALQSLLAK